MINDLTIHAQFTGVSSTVETIYKLRKADDKILSGVIALDDALKLAYIETFYCRFNCIPITSILDRASKNQSTGIILFEVCPNDLLSMKNSFVQRLLLSCEAMHIELLDVILCSQHDWASLRQQNLI